MMLFDIYNIVPCQGRDRKLDFDRSVFLAVIRHTMTSPTGNHR
jgi:hypothetical protein